VNGYDISKAKSPDNELPSGYIVVFSVVWRREGSVHLAVLRQSESVAYSTEPEKKDYIMGDEVGNSAPTLLSVTPSWKAGEACWPTFRGKLMTFVGEVSIPDTPEQGIW